MGQPAARITDMHVCPMVTGIVPHIGGPILPACAPTVLTGKLPQARITDMLVCVGPLDLIVKGSATVMVMGLPAARLGDNTAHGGVIVLGFPTVLIGDAAGGGGGGGGGGSGGTAGGGGKKLASAAKSTGAVSAALASSAAYPHPKKQAKTLKAAAKSGAAFCERCQHG